MIAAVLALLFAQSPDVRFHHVHYQVGDPSGAMSAAVASTGGSRVVVPGLGVGVRVDRQLLLYDRHDDSAAPARSQPPLAEASRTARAWLAGKGITASGDVSPVVAARAPSVPYHHVAFAAAEPERVIARLNATALKRTAESWLFDAGGGVLVEIVRDSDDAPDTFWCPMHPDERSPRGGTCPLCRMEFVPIPPPKLGEYRLDVSLVRKRSRVTGLRVAVREPGSNALVTDLRTVHEKPFHLFLVGRDLEYFAHVHPERRSDGSYDLAHPLPPGEYMLFADFLPVGGTSQLAQRALIVAGKPAVPKTSVAGSSEVVVDGMRIGLQLKDVAAGKDACLTFTLADEKTGAPIVDLEPYLGAPGHMLIVRDDLSDAVHVHPEEAATAGPTVSFHPLIPAAGTYKLWVQFQRAGKVVTAAFSLAAER